VPTAQIWGANAEARGHAALPKVAYSVQQNLQPQTFAGQTIRRSQIVLVAGMLQASMPALEWVK
jgi:hypothetical protein